GIVDIVVSEGLLMKKDIDETGHVMIGHELNASYYHSDISEAVLVQEGHLPQGSSEGIPCGSKLKWSLINRLKNLQSIFLSPIVQSDSL
ncbi:hypothetical protein Tco_1229238, partial [Tanacetum coccineum]